MRAAIPDLTIRSAAPLEAGWDSFVLDVDDEWIFRFPRRLEVHRALRTEIALLPALADALPVAVPRFVYVLQEPTFFTGYRKIAGRDLVPARQTARAARDVAGFLAALHAVPVAVARAAGVPGGEAADWRGEQERLISELERKAAPLLPRDARELAHAAFADFLANDSNFDFTPALVHYDLGPTHLLVEDDGALTGVIDWGDAAVGDPAVDLAWALHGARPEFAQALYDAYPGASVALRRRAAHYHRLGPWHEVVHGQATGDDSWIRTGLAGVVERLHREPSGGR